MSGMDTRWAFVLRKMRGITPAVVPFEGPQHELSIKRKDSRELDSSNILVGTRMSGKGRGRTITPEV